MICEFGEEKKFIRSKARAKQNLVMMGDKLFYVF